MQSALWPETDLKQMLILPLPRSFPTTKCKYYVSIIFCRCRDGAGLASQPPSRNPSTVDLASRENSPLNSLESVDRSSLANHAMTPPINLPKISTEPAPASPRATLAKSGQLSLIQLRDPFSVFSLSKIQDQLARSPMITLLTVVLCQQVKFANL